MKSTNCNIVGFGHTQNLGKYLGVHLSHARVGREVYSDLFDKILGRLSGWKNNCLSLAGRSTLVQAMTTAIPIHAMQSTWLPENVCDRLDKLNRDFLWSNNPLKRKLHLVGWQKVSKPKEARGLGVRVARVANVALLSKMVWKILRKENTVWQELIQAKYLRSQSLLDCVAKLGDSPAWKGILRCTEIIKPFFRWRIGDGNSISFWYDNWLGSGRICERIEYIDPLENQLRLVNVLQQDGYLSVHELNTVIPSNLAAELETKAIVLSDEADSKLWNGTANGEFSCQSAYKLIHSNQEAGLRRIACWKWIWKLQCTEAFFMARNSRTSSNEPTQVQTKSYPSVDNV